MTVNKKSQPSVTESGVSVFGIDNQSKIIILSLIVFFASQKLYFKALYEINFPFGMDFIKEFTIKINNSAKELKLNALKKSIFINTIHGDKTDSLIQICVTEKRTLEEIDILIDFLKTV